MSDKRGPDDPPLDDLTPEEQRALDEIDARLAELRADLDRIEADALADDATIDLTLEEVAALSSALELGPPAPVRLEISALSTQPGWSARLDTARRGLQARHLVDDDGRPVGPVARMLALLDEPVFVGHVDFELGDEARSCRARNRPFRVSPPCLAVSTHDRDDRGHHGSRRDRRRTSRKNAPG